MNTDRRTRSAFTIGSLAQAAGVGIGTVRLYQKRGLLPEPARPAYGGFRRYGTEDLLRLAQIRGAQEMGFTLAEIQQLFSHLDQCDCGSAREILERKLVELKERVRRLQSAHRRLAKLKTACSAGCDEGCLMREVFAGGRGD
jgi:MerR family mercuric resistance operon transcriptional regulator